MSQHAHARTAAGDTMEGGRLVGPVDVTGARRSSATAAVTLRQPVRHRVTTEAMTRRPSTDGDELASSPCRSVFF